MRKTFTTSRLITSVKNRAMIPDNQSTFDTQDFLDFANEEMDNELIPEILRLHEDYLLAREDIPLVSNQSRYPIPSKAMGNKLRDVAFVDDNGNIFELTRVGVGELSYYNSNLVQSKIYAFMVEGSDIVILPENTIPVSGSIRFYYYKQLNEMVEESRTAVITAIDTVTGEITVDDIPEPTTGNFLFDATETYDLINSKSPFNTLADDLVVSSVNTTTNVITFTAGDLPTQLKVGDYVNLSGETSVVQLPRELHSMLAHKVAMRCIEAMGDAQGLQVAAAKEQKMMDKLTNLIDNRVEDAPKKINNRHSPLKQGLYRRRFRHRG